MKCKQWGEMIAFGFKLSLYNHQLKSVYKSSYFKKAVTLEVRIRINCRREKSVQKKYERNPFANVAIHSSKNANKLLFSCWTPTLDGKQQAFGWVWAWVWFFFVFYVGSLSIQIVGNAKLVKFISSVFCPFYVLIHSSFWIYVY